jgi:hypothetical protein
MRNFPVRFAPQGPNLSKRLVHGAIPQYQTDDLVVAFGRGKRFVHRPPLRQVYVELTAKKVFYLGI